MLSCASHCEVGVFLPLSGVVLRGSLRSLRLSSASSLQPVVSLALISCWFSAPSSDARAVSGGGLWLGSSGRAGRGRAACWCRSQGADPTALLAGPGRRALYLLQKVRGNFSHYSANLTDECHFVLGGGGGSQFSVFFA